MSRAANNTQSGAKVKQERKESLPRARSPSGSSIEFVDDYMPTGRKRHREASGEVTGARAPFAPANGKRLKTEAGDGVKIPQEEVKYYEIVDASGLSCIVIE